VGLDPDPGELSAQSFGGRKNLLPPEGVRAVQNLPVQVGRFNNIVIDEHQGAHPGGRQMERSG
jgi:hypothetical protein